mmetsp:Transcript_32812/g.96767  ORF Transcript_32812/g.96767 Transcript_32812/m.96767 type:complete len:269 (-) Transcript_32812:253-1059(-)
MGGDGIKKDLQNGVTTVSFVITVRFKQLTKGRYKLGRQYRSRRYRHYLCRSGGRCMTLLRPLPGTLFSLRNAPLLRSPLLSRECRCGGSPILGHNELGVMAQYSLPREAAEVFSVSLVSMIHVAGSCTCACACTGTGTVRAPMPALLETTSPRPTRWSTRPGSGQAPRTARGGSYCITSRRSEGEGHGRGGRSVRFEGGRRSRCRRGRGHHGLGIQRGSDMRSGHSGGSTSCRSSRGTGIAVSSRRIHVGTIGTSAVPSTATNLCIGD